jgi:hypothetical protein
MTRRLPIVGAGGLAALGAAFVFMHAAGRM